MSIFRIVLPAVLLLLAACGGDRGMKCDKNVAYLQAHETPRVRAPDGLDELDPLREQPLPEASPKEARPADAGCLERPPQAVIN